MATSWSKWLAVCIVFTTTTYLFDTSEAAKSSPPLSRVKRWARNLESSLEITFSTLTGFDAVQKAYRKYWKPGGGAFSNVSFEPLQTTALVAEMSTKIAEMLSKKMEALNNSVVVAEEVAANYDWEQGLTKVSYYNANDMMNAQLTYNERFGQNVSFNFSSVHIPVEIYDGDLEILNGLNWTTHLDEVFRNNSEKDPEILWQYFGSQAGFMRSFPATAWKTHGSVDLYDVRRQSWYTQGSSSPKDMMILIDTSGSTHGQALQLMKVAVKSILDTLGENDFVNIATFSAEASFVSPCFNHTPFVQANYRNKQKLSNDVNRLTANGMANFKAGLTFAFEQFDKFQRNETNGDSGQQFGASCNKVIMMLTDGGTDNAEEVFKEFNWPNKTVRVFTYAVGPTANPTNAIRWMACANRGYFSQIPAMGAIRTRVQEYIPVLSRPQVLLDAKHYVWGSIYYDHLGLGMMTTVTLPVYNRTGGSSNQTILGVMGIDVTTADMVKKSPQRKLGPNGYAFAINPNGYIIFHPNLKLTNYMKDPPNVDLLEIEIENEEKDKLRSAMINEEIGTRKFETFVITGDGNYMTKDLVTYSYEPIINTSFSLGMSVPSYQTHYPAFNMDIKNFDTKYFASQDWEFLIAPWEYYKDMSRAVNKTGTIADILDVWDESVEWDSDLMSHLYWDAKVAAALDEYFVVVKGNFVNTKDHILTFIATNGGLTRVFPSSQSQDFEDHRDPYKAYYYKRVLSSEDKVFFMQPFSEVHGVNGSEVAPDVTVARAVTIKDGQTVYKPAVAGARFNNTKFVDSLVAETKDSEFYDCGDADSLWCYLVDEAGFLVASNQEEHTTKIGKFLGIVDPTVMHRLYNRSVYKRIKYYEYQVSHQCAADGKETSAGYPSIRLPSINLLFDALSVNWWTTKMAWLYLNFNFWNSWFTPQEAYAQEEEAYVVESCIEVVYLYHFGSGTTIGDSVDCSNCTRNIRTTRVDGTNLLLVVADPNCWACDILYTRMPQEAVRVTEDEEKEVVCDLAREPRYRKGTEECYSKDVREDTSKCGCVSSFVYSKLHIIVSLLVIMVSVHLMSNS